MTRSRVMLVLLSLLVAVSLLTANLAVAEKETTDEAKPVVTGGVLFQEICQNQPPRWVRIWDFDAQMSEWVKGVPVGTAITLHPESLSTDPAKTCLLFVSVGADIDNHIVRPFPTNGLMFRPHGGVNPVHIYATLKEGYRRDTSYLKSKGGLLRILGSIPIIGDLGGGSITADVKSSARYSFQAVPFSSDWSWTPLWAARFMAHMGAGGAPAFDLSPTAAELAEANGGTPDASEDKTASSAIEAVKARNSAKLAEWQRKHDNWTRLPRSKRVAEFKSRQTIVTGVLRFVEKRASGQSCTGDWSGCVTIWSLDERGERLNKLADVRVVSGQGLVENWRLGQRVSVDFGRGQPVVATESESGIIEISTFDSGSLFQQPDKLRRYLSKLELVMALREKEHFDGFGGLLQAHGFSYTEFCAIWPGRENEVGTVSPCQRFILKSGAGRFLQSQAWTPTSVEPCIWFTMRSGEKIAVQQMNEGNLLIAKLLPEPEPLKPIWGECKDRCEVVRPCDVPPEPQKPDLEPIPTYQWQGQVSGFRGLDAGNRVSIPEVQTDWRWLLPFMRERQRCSPKPGPVCVGTPATDPSPVYSGGTRVRPQR